MSEFSFKQKILFALVEFIGPRLVRAIGRTLDIELVNEKAIEAARALSVSSTWIFAVLHGRMFVPVYVMRNRNIHSTASQSADGEVVTRVVEKLGYKAFRGSSAKGGAEGMLGLIRVARKAVTANMVDGPTGPREDPKIGTVAIARAAGIPIIPLIGGAAPSLELVRAWDRFQFPFPFSKAVVALGDPMVVPADAKGDKLEASRLELKKRMVELREWVDARVWNRTLERRGGLLSPTASIWAAVSHARNAFFDSGIRRIVPSPVPVISVGNLTAGGSGKSPLVRELVQYLEKRTGSGRTAVVSRGYRRSTSGLRVVADRRGVLLNAGEGGDEPVMLARSLPGVPVLVAERRPEAISFAAANYGAKVVVLDDGFQHRAAQRNLDIVLLDSTTPASHWRMLPQGRMREGFDSLKRADLVVITGNAPEGVVVALSDKVREVTDVPVLRGGIEPVSLRSLDGSREEATGWVRDRKVTLCAAIARPRRFIDSAEELGAQIVTMKLYRDHEPITRDKVDELMRRAVRKGAEAVLITAKDAVKWPAARSEDLPVFIVETQWRWQRGKGELDEALDRIVPEPKHR